MLELVLPFSTMELAGCDLSLGRLQTASSLLPPVKSKTNEKEGSIKSGIGTVTRANSFETVFFSMPLLSIISKAHLRMLTCADISQVESLVAWW